MDTFRRGIISHYTKIHRKSRLIGHELTMLLPPPKGSGFPQLKQRLVIYEIHQEEKRKDVKKVASCHGKKYLTKSKKEKVAYAAFFYLFTCNYFLFRI